MFLETLLDLLEYVVHALHLHHQIKEEPGELLSELIQDTPIVQFRMNPVPGASSFEGTPRG